MEYLCDIMRVLTRKNLIRVRHIALRAREDYLSQAHFQPMDPGDWLEMRAGTNIRPFLSGRWKWFLKAILRDNWWTYVKVNMGLWDSPSALVNSIDGFGIRNFIQYPDSCVRGMSLPALVAWRDASLTELSESVGGGGNSFETSKITVFLTLIVNTVSFYFIFRNN